MTRVPARAEEVFAQGYNCSQAVLLACGEGRGLAPDVALRVAGPFGGGIGRLGETCGAVSGAIMALGLAYSKVKPDDNDSRERGYKLAREFIDRFTQMHGSVVCRDLLGCDLSTPAGLARAKELRVHEAVCPRFVRAAAEIVEELLAREAAADVKAIVKDKYAAVAESTLTNDHAGVRAVAQAFGYSAEELAAIPASANMGLSCGNPTATANLRPGETVVDLGSGGGLDVFLAAQKVGAGGATGKAIGIDMTQEMIDRARKGARDAGITNVEFHLAAIDKIPLPDSSVDCVISNCVINLAPDKPAVFREIARILKPGGRIAVSDIALKQPLPAELANDIAAYVGCIAGAILIDDYRAGLFAAGFSDVVVLDSGADLNAYAKLENQSACCSPAMATSSSLPIAKTTCCGSSAKSQPTSEVHARLAALFRQYNVNAYAASVKVFAVRK